MNLKLIPLQELVTKITDGAHHSPESVERGMPMASVKDLTEFGIDFSTCRHISNIDYQNLVKSGCKPLKGDILISKDGNSAIDTACEIKNNPEVVLLSSIAIIRPNPERLYPSYLKHLLSWDSYKNYIKTCFTSGAAIPRVILNDFKKCQIPTPNLETQKNIAGTLSAYNDLIENNKHRITILATIAEELYKEWFVRLRFPSANSIKISKGIPEQWLTKKLKTIVERKNFGKIYRETELADEGNIIVIDQSTKPFLGFYDGAPEHFATDAAPIILFGDHTCKMELQIVPFSLAENVVPFVGVDGISTFFLFYLIKNSIETSEYKRHWTELVNKEVIIPSNQLQFLFENKVAPIHSQIQKLKEANRILTKTRDILLTRLMNGKIDVENLDIKFPPSMLEEEVPNAYFYKRR